MEEKLDELKLEDYHSNYRRKESKKYSPPVTPKSQAYSQLSLFISMEVLRVCPYFPHWRPNTFARLSEYASRIQKQEPVGSLCYLTKIVQAVVSCYHLRLSSSAYKSMDRLYSKGLKYCNTLLSLAKHPKTTNPYWYDYIACHLILFLGYASSNRDEDSHTYSWRHEFIELLELFCNSSVGGLRKIAWAVDTTCPVRSPLLLKYFQGKNSNVLVELIPEKEI